MVFRCYDMNHTFLGMLSSDYCTNLQIDETLENGYKNMSFSIASNHSNLLVEEGYLETNEDEFVIRELNKENNDYYFVQSRGNIETLERTMIKGFESLTHKSWEAANLAVLHTGWTIVNDIDSTSAAYQKDRTIRLANGCVLDVLNMIRDVYEIDIWYDTKQKQCHLTDFRGKDLGYILSTEIDMNQFTLQSSTYDFYTRIYPYGKDSLSIASINGGVPYLENHTYSDKVLSIVWIDQRYTVAEHLMEDAASKLAEMAVPLRSYSCHLLDLKKKDVEIGDIVTFVDPAKKIKEKQRVTSINYYPLAVENSTITIANQNLSFSQKQKRMDKIESIVDYNADDAGVITGTGGGGGSYPSIADFTRVNTNLLDAINVEADALSAEEGTISDFTATTAEVGSLHATTGYFDNFDIGQVIVDDLTVENLTVTDTIDFNHGVGNTLQVDSIVNRGQYTGYLTADNFAAGAITSDKITIANGYITAVMIGDGQITTAKIQDASITSAKIVELDASKITTGTLSTERLIIVDPETNRGIVYEINNANDTAELSTMTIDGGSITRRTITADNIVAGTITGNEISANSLTANNLSADSITTEKITSGSVTTDKLATGSITADKIQGGSITLGALSQDVMNFLNSLGDGSTDYSDEAIRQFRAELEQYLSFSQETGLILGSPESDILIQLVNDRMSFKQNGAEVAYISNDKLYINNAEITNKLKMGHYVWVPRKSGNLSLIWED